MNYLHQLKPPIVHRDLKSPNLLVDSTYTVKVSMEKENFVMRDLYDRPCLRLWKSVFSFISFLELHNVKAKQLREFILLAIFKDNNDVCDCSGVWFWPFPLKGEHISFLQNRRRHSEFHQPICVESMHLCIKILNSSPLMFIFNSPSGWHLKFSLMSHRMRNLMFIASA